MKYIYMIASAAAKCMKSEQALWDAISAAGFPVRDIHALTRISQHDIAVAEPAVARLARRRIDKTDKEVKLIALVGSDEVVTERLKGFPKGYVEKELRDARTVGMEAADFCVPADELDAAARVIISIIQNLEDGA